MKFPKGFELLQQPLRFQSEGIVFGMIHPNPGILFGVGLGKTMVAINIARYRVQFSNVNKILVLAPTSIMYNWAKEIKKFSEYESIILHGGKKERLYRLKYFKNDPNLRFGIINYEAVQIPDFFNKLREINPNLIIADESARYIKSNLANRTEATIALGQQTLYRMILTATPIAHRPMDIWSQFRFLDGGALFTDNFYRFRHLYFIQRKFPRYTQYVIKPERRKDITRKIYSTCIRFTKEQVKDDLEEFYGMEVLTEHAYQIIKIPMSRRLTSLYNQVKKEVLAEIETMSGLTRLNIRSIFTKLLRLQQITGGFTVNEDKEIVLLKEKPKLDATIEEVDSIVDAEESCVVWCRFRPSMNLISSELHKKGIKHYYMSGDDSPKEKESKWRGFQSSDTINVFLGQIRAGGIGIELFKIDGKESKSQSTIFYENEWPLEVRVQAEGRIDRIGQRSLCRYVDIVLENTIDERMLESIREGQEIADSILKRGVKGFLL